MAGAAELIDPFDNEIPDIVLPNSLILENEKDSITCCAFNRRGTYLACGTAIGEVLIFDVYAKNIARKWKIHSSEVNSIMWVKSGLGRLLLTSSSDATIKLFNIENETTIVTRICPTRVHGASLCPLNNQLCLVSPGSSNIKSEDSNNNIPPWPYLTLLMASSSSTNTTTTTTNNNNNNENNQVEMLILNPLLVNNNEEENNKNKKIPKTYDVVSTWCSAYVLIGGFEGIIYVFSTISKTWLSQIQSPSVRGTHKGWIRGLCLDRKNSLLLVNSGGKLIYKYSIKFNPSEGKQRKSSKSISSSNSGDDEKNTIMNINDSNNNNNNNNNNNSKKRSTTSIDVELEQNVYNKKQLIREKNLEDGEYSMDEIQYLELKSVAVVNNIQNPLPLNISENDDIIKTSISSSIVRNLNESYDSDATIEYVEEEEQVQEEVTFTYVRSYRDTVDQSKWNDIGFCADGEYVIAVSSMKISLHRIHIWGIDGLLLRILDGNNLLEMCCVHPWRALFAAINSDGNVEFWGKAKKQNFAAFCPNFKEVDDNIMYEGTAISRVIKTTVCEDIIIQDGQDINNNNKIIVEKPISVIDPKIVERELKLNRTEEEKNELEYVDVTTIEDTQLFSECEDSDEEDDENTPLAYIRVDRAPKRLRNGIGYYLDLKL